MGADAFVAEGARGPHFPFPHTHLSQGGWWDIDEHRRPQWEQSEDAIGQQMMAAVGDANRLRVDHPVLRKGWSNILHEDRPNGVGVGKNVGECGKVWNVLVIGGIRRCGGEAPCCEPVL